jgi:hypothetical protein
MVVIPTALAPASRSVRTHRACRFAPAVPPFPPVRLNAGDPNPHRRPSISNISFTTNFTFFNGRCVVVVVVVVVVVSLSLKSSAASTNAPSSSASVVFSIVVVVVVARFDLRLRASSIARATIAATAPRATPATRPMVVAMSRWMWRPDGCTSRCVPVVTLSTTLDARVRT